MADPIGTIRVHPDDDPRDPGARRVIRTDREVELRWVLITGRERAGADWGSRSDAEIGLGEFSDVMGLSVWPRQSLAELAHVLGLPEAVTRA